MSSVGVRELKEHTSEIVRRLRRPMVAVVSQAPPARQGHEAPVVMRTLQALNLLNLPVTRTIVRTRAVYQTVLDRYGQRLPDAADLSRAMRRQLGREALWEAGRAYGLGRAEQASVAELTAFAADCWPDASRHPLYRTVASHRRIGPRSAGFMLTHKGQWWLRRRSWKLRGY